MKKPPVFLLLIALLLSCFSSLCQVGPPYTANNEAFFKIIGTEQDYEFISHHLKTRMDRERKKFEFILPMETLLAVEDPLHLKILRDIFPVQTTPTIFLTAILEDETVSLEDFAEPTRLELNGVLTLNNESFYLPVEISVYANGNELFYNMVVRFDLDLLDRSYEGIYKNIITGEFAIYVNDALWNSSFPE